MDVMIVGGVRERVVYDRRLEFLIWICAAEGRLLLKKSVNSQKIINAPNAMETILSSLSGTVPINVRKKRRFCR